MEEEDQLPEIGTLPQDIIDPGEVFWIMPLVWWCVTGLVLLIGLVILVVWLVKRKRPERIPVEHLAPPRTEAISRLEELQAIAPQSESSTLAVELNRTLKRFLSRQYGADLRSQTTQEFWNTQDEWGPKLTSELANAVAAFFEVCDTIKYQPTTDSEAEKRDLFDRVSAIVQYQPAHAG